VANLLAPFARFAGQKSKPSNLCDRIAYTTRVPSGCQVVVAAVKGDITGQGGTEN